METHIRKWYNDEYLTNKINIYVPESSTSKNIYICEDEDGNKIVFRLLDDRMHEITNKIPNGIFPEIIYTNKSSGYYIEKFIDGVGINYNHLVDTEIIRQIILKIKNLQDVSVTAIELTCIDNFGNILNKKLKCLREANIIGIKEVELITSYIEFLQEFKYNTEYEYIFCHSDVHIGNIIKNENKIIIIDQEYLCLNYWLYDFVNLIEETFIYFDNSLWETKEYFVDDENIKIIEETKNKNMMEIIYNNIITNIIDIYKIEKHDELNLIKNFDIFRIYPNLFWYMWSLEKFECTKDIKYFNYSIARMNRIKKLISK